MTQRPIGYVVSMRLPSSGSWEPAALTNITEGDEGSKQLLARSCFSMFPTEEAAVESVYELAGQPWVRGVEVRVCAVFPANISAPHGLVAYEDDM